MRLIAGLPMTCASVIGAVALHWTDSFIILGFVSLLGIDLLLSEHHRYQGDHHGQEEFEFITVDGVMINILYMGISYLSPTIILPFTFTSFCLAKISILIYLQWDSRIKMDLLISNLFVITMVQDCTVFIVWCSIFIQNTAVSLIANLVVDPCIYSVIHRATISSKDTDSTTLHCILHILIGIPLNILLYNCQDLSYFVLNMIGGVIVGSFFKRGLVKGPNLWFHTHIMSGLYLLLTSQVKPPDMIMRWMCGFSIEICVTLYEGRIIGRKYILSQMLLMTAASIIALCTCMYVHKFTTEFS